LFRLSEMGDLTGISLSKVQTIVSDNKCQELWQFLRRHRSETSFTRQEIIQYRRGAERHVGTDDNLYRVEWVRLYTFGFGPVPNQVVG
jgi:paired amphipathic helix protein Sin3a